MRPADFWPSFSFFEALEPGNFLTTLSNIGKALQRQHEKVLPSVWLDLAN